MSHHLRFRQIHLDFHTSPAIEGIGSKFDKKQYQEGLKKGHVDSITTFALCHHGWSYYDTKIGKRHPHLSFDLLRAQFDACKEIDINVPIYLTAGVHNVMAEEQPGWREVNEEGKYSGWGASPIQPGFKKMCFNTPYLDHLCDQISEVVRLFPDNDGIFLDIIFQNPCCCARCIDSMHQKGFDPLNPEDRRAHGQQVLMEYYKRTTEAAKCDNPNNAIFHNSGHITIGKTDILEYFSHLELESLPTGGWGYDHFPVSAKYCKKIDKDFLGMTGKFHTTWGEFGGYKHPNALRYECAAMLAYGSKCSVGDQLHPNGQIDDSTYSIIGAAYKEVEEKEAWCDYTVNVADIAVLSSDGINGTRESAGDTGACRILLESHFLFDLIDHHMDFSAYKMLILPDSIKVNADLKAKIDTYLAGGGKLLLSGDSGLNEEGTEFVFDIGADFEGKSEFDPDYLVANDDLKPSFITSPLVMYSASNKIKVTNGSSMGKVCEPYFNKNYKHFCSHQHTPNDPDKCSYDCGVINGNIMYIAHPVFSIYRALGAVSYKEYAVNAINKFFGSDNSIKTNMPSTARVSLMNQAGEDRYILHLLYANTISRGGARNMSGGTLSAKARSVEVIEELIPLYNTEVEVKVEKDVKKVTLEPQGKELPFEMNDGKICLKVDEFTCHQMIVLHY